MWAQGSTSFQIHLQEHSSLNYCFSHSVVNDAFVRVAATFQYQLCHFLFSQWNRMLQVKLHIYLNLEKKESQCWVWINFKLLESNWKHNYRDNLFQILIRYHWNQMKIVMDDQLRYLAKQLHHFWIFLEYVEWCHSLQGVGLGWIQVKL